MNYLSEKVSEAEYRSDEIQQFFHELEMTTGFAIELKSEYTLQQFIEMSFGLAGGGKIRKISTDMLDAVDPSDSYLLRKKVNTLGTPMFKLCSEIATATRFGSLERKRQSLYVFLNSALSKRGGR